tara:strand:+ start:135 stop:905 length:771 start_codon:yes stop_codon:yes gene_type:complete
MRSLINKLHKILVKFIIPVKNNSLNKIEHYGTYYGGYDIVNKNDIKTVISCGLGEDATFDVEILNKFDCRIIAIDPTPRSIIHYNEISKKFGKKNDKNYETKGGRQNVNCYNLENINEKKFIFLDKAITDKNNSKIKLYFPINEEFVSTSLENDKNYSSKYLLADTINLENIIEKYEIKNIDILKLDIEGGELLVLKDIINKKIFPDQILVEFKNIKSFNIFTLFKIFNLTKKLIKNGYQVVNVNKKGDYTFLKIS